MGSGLEGFDFSHEGVKRVVGLLIGFVSVIASALYCFLYFNQRIHDDKKKKNKKKKKKPPISYTPLPATHCLQLGPQFIQQEQDRCLPARVSQDRQILLLQS